MYILEALSKRCEKLLLVTSYPSVCISATNSSASNGWSL